MRPDCFVDVAGGQLERLRVGIGDANGVKILNKLRNWHVADNDRQQRHLLAGLAKCSCGTYLRNDERRPERPLGVRATTASDSIRALIKLSRHPLPTRTAFVSTRIVCPSDASSLCRCSASSRSSSLYDRNSVAIGLLLVRAGTDFIRGRHYGTLRKKKGLDARVVPRKRDGTDRPRPHKNDISEHIAVSWRRKSGPSPTTLTRPRTSWTGLPARTTPPLRCFSSGSA